MRIPVSKSDLDEGRFTKISRALQKLWQSEVSLMQAQNVLAGLFGYRNLHDLQSHASERLVPPTLVMSRATINAAVAWRLFRRHGMNLSAAGEFASKLHLENLSVDALTLDAAFERTQENYRAKGKFLVMDEASSMMEPHWHPKTPHLLDANIPGYSYAVLPDLRVFRWSLLENLLGRLPSDYLDDLRLEPRYSELPFEAVESTFFHRELLPQACETLLDTVRKAQILPNGFSITWLFTSNGDCIGRVLNNTSLGGIIPVIYGIEDDGVFHAAGKLLSGETIGSPDDIALGHGDPLYVLRFGFGGFDLAKDIRASDVGRGEGRKPAIKELAKLPDHIRYQIVDGQPVLLGKTFVERNQVYLRNQQWLSPADIPNIILQKENVPALVTEQSAQQYLNTSKLIPDAASSLYQAAEERTEQVFSDAAKRLQTVDGIAKLIALLFRTVKTSNFDAYCDALIDEALPLRYEDDTEDNQDLIEDRVREIQNLEWNGQRIKEVIPDLVTFKDTTLGLILLLANGEYPGSRYGGLVYPPKAGERDAIVNLLTGLVFHAVCSAFKVEPPHEAVESKVLNFVVDRVLMDKATPDGIPNKCATVTRYCKKLAEQAKFLTQVQEWQKGDDEILRLRATGKFLYVGKAIPRQKPKGLAELMSMGRSKGFAPVVAEQTLPDMDSPVHS